MTEQDAIKASVIIPTFNRSGPLKRCIQALCSQQTAIPYELIVVDDGSSEDVDSAVIGFSRVRLFMQAHGGPAAARNLGAAEARGEFLLFTDDDCEADPHWIESMTKPFEDAGVAGVKGVYVTSQPQLVARFVQCEYEEKYDRLSSLKKIDQVDTCSGAFRRSVFEAQKGFRETYSTTSLEDMDFDHRLIRLGYRFVFEPDARVKHTHPSTVIEYVKKKFNNGYWGIMILKKYPNTIAHTSYTPPTQRLQVLLAGGFLPSLVFAAFVGGGWLLPVSVAALFLLSSVRLTLIPISVL